MPEETEFDVTCYFEGTITTRQGGEGLTQEAAETRAKENVEAAFESHHFDIDVVVEVGEAVEVEE